MKVPVLRVPLAVLAAFVVGLVATGASGAGVAPTPLTKLLPSDIQKTATVVLATDASYPPCQWFPAPGKPMIGFEVDLWNAMARQLGVTIKVVNTQFDGLIPGVQSGRYHVAMECLSDQPAREKVVTFVDAYYSKGAIYATKARAKSAGITRDPLSLCGLTVSVQAGTDYINIVDDHLNPHCVKRGKPAIKKLLFPAQHAVLLALYSGRADFNIVDLAAGSYLLRKAPKPSVVIPNKILPQFYLGMVFNKKDVKTQKAFLAALKAIHKTGEYDRIMRKWKLQDLVLESPGINLATRRPIRNTP